MIVVSIETVVSLVLYVLVVGAIFGLLFYLTYYLEREWPYMQPFCKIARVILVVLGILVLIGILLAFIGHPVFVLR